MKASIIATLITSALAAPSLIARQADTFTFSVSNDITGTNIPRSVLADGGSYSFGSIFAGSNLVKNGRVIATSAQNLMPNGSGIECVINAAGVGLRLDDQNTFAQLDGNYDAAVETDVTDFSIRCSKKY
jgi:hypothetical protein